MTKYLDGRCIHEGAYELISGAFDVQAGWVMGFWPNRGANENLWTLLGNLPRDFTDSLGCSLVGLSFLQGPTLALGRGIQVARLGFLRTLKSLLLAGVAFGDVACLVAAGRLLNECVAPRGIAVLLRGRFDAVNGRDANRFGRLIDAVWFGRPI